jgi:hypothetical protein
VDAVFNKKKKILTRHIGSRPLGSFVLLNIKKNSAVSSWSKIRRVLATSVDPEIAKPESSVSDPFFQFLWVIFDPDPKHCQKFTLNL